MKASQCIEMIRHVAHYERSCTTRYGQYTSLHRITFRLLFMSITKLITMKTLYVKNKNITILHTNYFNNTD